MFLYRIDFNQKKKYILFVLPPDTAFLLGKTRASTGVEAAFFQTTLLRIQSRSIVLLH